MKKILGNIEIGGHGKGGGVKGSRVVKTWKIEQYCHIFQPNM